MNSPREEYDFLKKIDNIWDIASETLFQKYIIKGLRGTDKLQEIESTDQESLMSSLNGGFPVPGMVYTFIYKGKEMILELGKGKLNEFIDYIPIVFCINNDSEHFSGINLNMIPPEPRLGFLQDYYKVFQDFFKDVERKTQNNKLAINRRFIELVKSGDGQKLIKLFNIRNGANYNFGYRKYSIKNVDSLRMIEYNEWNYLPFYRPIQAFRTLPLNEIYKLYYQYRPDQ